MLHGTNASSSHSPPFLINRVLLFGITPISTQSTSSASITTRAKFPKATSNSLSFSLLPNLGNIFGHDLPASSYLPSSRLPGGGLHQVAFICPLIESNTALRFISQSNPSLFSSAI